MKKHVFIVAIAGVVIGIGYALFLSGHASSAVNPEKKTVKTAPVVSVAFQETEQFSGFVGGAKQADIAPKVGGYLVKLAKEEGESVFQGEVLAVLDGTELAATRKSALLSLDSIKKSVRETKKYYEQKIDEAQTALDNASGSSATAAADEAVKSVKRLRDAEVAALKTQQAAAEGQTLVSGVTADNMIVRAPFTGVITRKNSSLGSFVAPGMPIYSLASSDAFEVVVELPTTVALGITKNVKASVMTNDANIEGYVFSVVSLAGENLQRSVARVRMAGSAERTGIRLGEYVRVAFLVGTPRPALFIPERAIVSQYDDTFVYVIENGLAEKHSVVLGRVSGDTREVLSGLAEGAHVVVEGWSALSDNQPIEEIYAAQ